MKDRDIHPPSWRLYRQLMTLSDILCVTVLICSVIVLWIGSGWLEAVAGAVLRPAALAWIVVAIVKFVMNGWRD